MSSVNHESSVITSSYIDETKERNFNISLDFDLQESLHLPQSAKITKNKDIIKLDDLCNKILKEEGDVPIDKIRTELIELYMSIKLRKVDKVAGIIDDESYVKEF